MTEMNGVEATKNYERGEFVSVFSVFNYRQHNFVLTFKMPSATSAKP